MSVSRIDIFPNASTRDLNNLNIYKSCTEDESCIHYMFKNGSNIYKELDPFQQIPKQVEESKLLNIFSTNNIIRDNLLNDTYIQTLQTKLKISDPNIIINSILLHLRPIIFQQSLENINDVNITDIKTRVEETLEFDNRYMKNIKTQIEFLLKNETIQHIKSEVKNNIGNIQKSIKDEYIKKILANEINNYRSRYGSDREVKKMPDTIYDRDGSIAGIQIYTTLLSKLNTRDIFNIINDTISQISSNIMIEDNMIQNNSKLDKWDTILNDNNRHGLRQYTSIKINNKKPPGMMFNMNY